MSKVTPSVTPGVTPNGKPGALDILQIGLPFVWAGLVLGLSFIETPLKFQAPGITQILGVGIGHLVFATLNRIELAFSVLMLATLLMESRDPVKYWIFGLILAIVLVQTFWLLPALDAEAQRFIAGTPGSAFSGRHVLFVVLESIKLIALLALGTLAARRR